MGFLLAALLDPYRRTKEQMRGNKAVWTPAAFVNFVGLMEP
jgi:hypothetical protein